LKAFYVAVALVVSFGPAGANDLASPGHDAGVAEAAQMPTNQTLSEEAEAPLFAADPKFDSVAEAESGEISDALKAKVKAIIAFMRKEVSSGVDDGTELVGSRIRVRCAAKKVVAKQKKPSLAAMPALMLSERATSKDTPASFTTTVEACTLKLLQFRRSSTAETSTDAGDRSFAMELPASEYAH
jgi:hypothetical protein